MGYTQNAIKGTLWISSFRIVTRILSFVKIAILARILTPSQFGIFGIASLVLALLEMLTETGINIVLIQSKKEISKYINSAWVISILRGTIIAMLIIILSPFIESFFHNSDSLGILLFISLIPFVRGFINPSEIRLQKDLQFHYEFWFRVSIFLIDAVVAIIFTITTRSVYSLVFGLLAGSLLEVFLSLLLIKPMPKFQVQKDYFSEIFHKGKWITGYGILNYFAQEGDNIIVGRLIGASALGVYQMAYKISTLPISEGSDIINKVVFPVFSKIQHEQKRLKKAFTKTMFILSAISVIIGLMVFSFPKEIILILLGDKWISAVSVVQILAVYGVLRAISGTASTLFLALSKQQYITWMTFIRFGVLACTIYPFVHLFGIVGAAYSALISVVAEIPLLIYFTHKVLKNS